MRTNKYDTSKIDAEIRRARVKRDLEFLGNIFASAAVALFALALSLLTAWGLMMWFSEPSLFGTY